MKLVNYILMSTIVLCTFKTTAQKKWEFSFGPQYGYAVQPSFRKFSKSYNTYFDTTSSGEKMTSKLGSLSHLFGGMLTARFYLNDKLSVIFGYQQLRSRTYSEFDSKERRIFKYRIGSPIMGGAGFKAGEGGVFDVVFMFSNVEMQSYYKYSDGSISYGTEKRLNGIYNTQQFVIDLAYSKRFKKFPLLFRIDAQLAALGNLAVYRESNYPRALQISVNNLDELPENYTSIFNPNYQSLGGKSISSNYYMLSFSLQYVLSNKKEKNEKNK